MKEKDNKWSNYYKEAAELLEINPHNLCKAYATIKEEREKLIEKSKTLLDGISFMYPNREE